MAIINNNTDKRIKNGDVWVEAGYIFLVPTIGKKVSVKGAIYESKEKYEEMVAGINMSQNMYFGETDLKWEEATPEAIHNFVLGILGEGFSIDNI